MCVIVYSPKGIDAPTEELIRQMFLENPDGAGFAWNGADGKVKYRKGFMKVEDLLQALEPLDKWKNTNLAIHFRIGTAGENDEYTCHPFKISNKYKDLRELEGEGPVLFHNGIMGKGGIVDKNSSDTQDFVVAFSPMIEKFNKSKARDAAISEYTKGNKLLIMYNNNKVKMFGNWEKDGDLFVSNKNYKYIMPKNTYAWYDQYNYRYYEGDYDKWWKEKDKEKEEEETKKLWDELKNKKYVWLNTVSQMRQLLDSADDVTETYVIKDGMAYVYDEEDLAMWSAEYD